MHLFSLCNEMDGSAPDWIQVLPSGPTIQGRDGRVFKLSDPNSIVTQFLAKNIPLVVDYDHGSENTLRKGDLIPAAGWINSIEVRNGEVWGNVEWTAKAKNAIENKEYRFISPAFMHTVQGEILSISSVAITNKPNLEIKSLNTEGSFDPNDWQDVALALNVESINSPQDVLTALNKQQLQHSNIEYEKAVDTAISEAIFTPASRDFLLSACSISGLEGFNEFKDATIRSGKTYQHILERKVPSTPRSSATSQLTSTEIAACKGLQLNVDDYIRISEG